MNENFKFFILLVEFVNKSTSKNPINNKPNIEISFTSPKLLNNCPLEEKFVMNNFLIFILIINSSCLILNIEVIILVASPIVFALKNIQEMFIKLKVINQDSHPQILICKLNQIL